MGANCSKFKVIQSSSIDHGSYVPQGLYTTDTDYDLNVVRALIRKGQLAPFYQGASDTMAVDKIAYDTECPICFLFYPSNMNRTRCCDKSICTECFLQLRRSSSSPLVPAVCPFCVQPNLGVLYIPPPWSKHYLAFKRRRSDLFTKAIHAKDESEYHHRRKWHIPANDPDVVLVDTVRPKWEEMLQERRVSTSGTTRRIRVQLAMDDLLDDGASNHTIYDTYADIDLEDVLVMEAIRLSLMTSNADVPTVQDN